MPLAKRLGCSGPRGDFKPEPGCTAGFVGVRGMARPPIGTITPARARTGSQYVA